MKKCDWGIEKLRTYLNQNVGAGVVCFGAGMVAQHVKYIFEKYNLWDKVCCFVDNDPDKQGRNIVIGKKIFPILNPMELRLKKHVLDVIIILLEYTEEIEKQLQEQKDFSPRYYVSYISINQEIIRESLLHEKSNFLKIVQKKSGMRIPPILHYCWFGQGEIPEKQRDCLKTWEKYCPDYTIMMWNESNYNINVCRYMKEAYETKNYAFVSDYARMDVVYQYGGIYLDTDVEIKQNLDWLRKYKAFFAYGKWPAVNSGCGFGAEPKSELIREIRDDPRKNIPFIMKNGKCNRATNCYYESKILEKHGFCMNFLSQTVEEVLLLSPLFFPSSIHMDLVKEESAFIMARHHDAGSWRN